MDKDIVNFQTWYNFFVAPATEIPSNLKKVIFVSCGDCSAKELMQVVRLASMDKDLWQTELQKHIEARILTSEDCTTLRKLACYSAGIGYATLRAYFKNTGRVNLHFLDYLVGQLSIHRKHQQNLLIYVIEHGSLDYLFNDTNCPDWKKDLDGKEEEEEEEEEEEACIDE